MLLFRSVAPFTVCAVRRGCAVRTVHSPQPPNAVGGGKTCKKEYFYSRAWRSEKISSASFFNSQYQNPSTWAVEAASWTPKTLHAGNYSLPVSLIAQVADCNVAPCAVAPLPPASAVPALPICARSAPGQCKWALRDMAGAPYFYYSAGYEAGGVGDIRVTFRKSAADAVSVVAVQQVTLHPAGGERGPSRRPGPLQPLRIFLPPPARAAPWKGHHVRPLHREERPPVLPPRRRCGRILRSRALRRRRPCSACSGGRERVTPVRPRPRQAT